MDEEKMARVIGFYLRKLDGSRNYSCSRFREDWERNVLKKVEEYRAELKSFLDHDFVDSIFEREGFPLGSEYRRGMIEEIASWRDENWFTRRDLEKMPTEWLERILGMNKEDE